MIFFIKKAVHNEAKSYSLLPVKEEPVAVDMLDVMAGKATPQQKPQMTFCCDAMKVALLTKFIKVSLFTGTPVLIHHYEDYDNWTEDTADINFCPFCGEKIKTEVKEQVRLVQKSVKFVSRKIELVEEPL